MLAEREVLDDHFRMSAAGQSQRSDEYKDPMNDKSSGHSEPESRLDGLTLLEKADYLYVEFGREAVAPSGP